MARKVIVFLALTMRLFAGAAAEESPAVPNSTTLIINRADDFERALLAVPSEIDKNNLDAALRNIRVVLAQGEEYFFPETLSLYVPLKWQAIRVARSHPAVKAVFEQEAQSAAKLRFPTLGTPIERFDFLWRHHPASDLAAMQLELAIREHADAGRVAESRYLLFKLESIYGESRPVTKAALARLAPAGAEFDFHPPTEDAYPGLADRSIEFESDPSRPAGDAPAGMAETEKLLLVNNGGAIYCVDRTDLSVVGIVAPAGKTAALPLANRNFLRNGKNFITIVGGSILAFDPTDFSVVWEVDICENFAEKGRVSALTGLAATNDFVCAGIFVSRTNHEFYRLIVAADTGKIVKSDFQNSAYAENFLGVRLDPLGPVTTQTGIFFPGGWGVAGLCGLKDGRPRWLFRYTSIGHPLDGYLDTSVRPSATLAHCHKNVLFFKPSDSIYLYALNEADGSLKWQSPFSFETRLTAGGDILLACDDERLVRIDPETGRIAAMIEIRDPGSIALTARGLCVSANSEFYLLHPRTLSVIARRKLPSPDPVSSFLRIDDGTIFVAGANSLRRIRNAADTQKRITQLERTRPYSAKIERIRELLAQDRPFDALALAETLSSAKIFEDLPDADGLIKEIEALRERVFAACFSAAGEDAGRRIELAARACRLTRFAVAPTIRLAREYERGGMISTAAEVYHNQFGMRDQPYSDDTHDIENLREWAHGQIERMVETYGYERVFTSIDRRIEKVLAAGPATKMAAGEILARYPFSHFALTAATALLPGPSGDYDRRAVEAAKNCLDARLALTERDAPSRESGLLIDKIVTYYYEKNLHLKLAGWALASPRVKDAITRLLPSPESARLLALSDHLDPGEFRHPPKKAFTLNNRLYVGGYEPIEYRGAGPQLPLLFQNGRALLAVSRSSGAVVWENPIFSDFNFRSVHAMHDRFLLLGGKRIQVVAAQTGEALFSRRFSIGEDEEPLRRGTVVHNAAVFERDFVLSVNGNELFVFENDGRGSYSEKLRIEMPERMNENLYRLDDDRVLLFFPDKSRLAVFSLGKGRIIREKTAASLLAPGRIVPGRAGFVVCDGLNGLVFFDDDLNGTGAVRADAALRDVQASREGGVYYALTASADGESADLRVYAPDGACVLAVDAVSALAPPFATGDRLFCQTRNAANSGSAAIEAYSLAQRTKLWVAPLENENWRGLTLLDHSTYILVYDDLSSRLMAIEKDTGRRLLDCEFLADYTGRLGSFSNLVYATGQQGTTFFTFDAAAHKERGIRRILDGLNAKEKVRLLERRLADEEIDAREATGILSEIENLSMQSDGLREPIVFVPFLHDPPSIDGAIDRRFDRRHVFTMNAPRFVTRNADVPISDANWYGPNDLSADVYVGFNEEKIFVAVDVLDDFQVPMADSARRREGDSLSIEIGNFGRILALAKKKEKASDDEEKKDMNWFTIKPKDDGTGYRYEMAIPWSVTGIDPHSNDKIPFNLLILDDDGLGVKKGLSLSPGIFFGNRPWQTLYSTNGWLKLEKNAHGKKRP